MSLLYLCFFIIGLNFQVSLIEQELIDVHKYDYVFVLIAFYRVFGDYNLSEVIRRYIHQRA